MSHQHVLFDTCIWLDLATEPAADEILTKLEQLIQLRRFTLVVPEIVREEFDRNKEECAAKLAKRITDRVKETAKFSKRFAASEEKLDLLKLLTSLQQRIAALPIAAVDTIRRIEVLLQHPENKCLKSSDKILARAAQRGCEKIAPFVGNKNSVADAVIMESFSDFIAKHGESDSCKFSFVTTNKSDFCDPSDHRKPHPDFSELFDGDHLRFSINVAEVINTLVEEISSEDDSKVEPVSEELVHQVETWGSLGVDLMKCPKCNEGNMQHIGGHPSQYGGWSAWQMCSRCGFKWDTGEPID